MIGLPWGKKNCDNTLSRFHRIPERDKRTDGQTDIAISISRVSVLTRDKNSNCSDFGIDCRLSDLKIFGDNVNLCDNNDSDSAGSLIHIAKQINVVYPDCISSARLTNSNYVRPSVCLSRSGIVSKQLNMSSYFLSPIILVCPILNIFAKFRRGHPLYGGVEYRWGISIFYWVYQYFTIFHQICRVAAATKGVTDVFPPLPPPPREICTSGRSDRVADGNTGVPYVSSPVRNFPCDINAPQISHNCWKFTVVTLSAQLTRDLLAIAKFLVIFAFSQLSSVLTVYIVLPRCL